MRLPLFMKLPLIIANLFLLGVLALGMYNVVQYHLEHGNVTWNVWLLTIICLIIPLVNVIWISKKL